METNEKILQQHIEEGLEAFEQFETLIQPEQAVPFILQLRTMLLCKNGTLEATEFAPYNQKIQHFIRLLQKLAQATEAKQIRNARVPVHSQIPKFPTIAELYDFEDDFEEVPDGPQKTVICNFCEHEVNIYEVEQLDEGLYWCGCSNMEIEDNE